MRITMLAAACIVALAPLRASAEDCYHAYAIKVLGAKQPDFIRLEKASARVLVGKVLRQNPRGEFETAEAYEARLAKAQLQATYLVDDAPREWSYDIDNKTITITKLANTELSPSSADETGFYWIAKSDIKMDTYIGENAFGVKTPVKRWRGSEEGILIANKSWSFFGGAHLRANLSKGEPTLEITDVDPAVAKALRSGAQQLNVRLVFTIPNTNPDSQHLWVNTSSPTRDSPYDVDVTYRAVAAEARGVVVSLRSKPLAPVATFIDGTKVPALDDPDKSCAGFYMPK